MTPNGPPRNHGDEIANAKADTARIVSEARLLAQLDEILAARRLEYRQRIADAREEHTGGGAAWLVVAFLLTTLTIIAALF